MEKSIIINRLFLGSSYRINNLYRNGAPWEISVRLVNELYKVNNDISLYVVLPFNLDDTYIVKLAELFKEQLNENINIYLEYNNEAWNPIFHGAKYVRHKGRIHNPEPDKNLYREGYKYYAYDAVRVFNIFNTRFPRIRTNRVLGSFQWNPHLTKGLLEYKNTHRSIDSIAIGTYFYMCFHSDKCKDDIGLDSFNNSNEIEEYLLSPDNRYSIPSLLKNIQLHYDETSKYNVDLISYEGGLHITVQDLQHEDAEHFTKILNRFSDSEHAYSLYNIFLKGIKEQGLIDTWVAFTSPQTYHKWGPFGVKQTLNGTGPKYQAIMENK